MEADAEVMYAGVGSQSDLGCNKGLQAKGAVRDNKFQLLAGSIIAPAAPALNKKAASHPPDLAFDSASQAFIYAYGTNPPGGKLTWTPPSRPGRVVRKHASASPKQTKKNEKDNKEKEKEKEKANDVDGDYEDIAGEDDEVEVPGCMQVVADDDAEEDDEDESQLRPPSRASSSGLKVVQAKREQVEEEEEEEELSEVDAELAYIEAKIRLLQIRKKKLLQEKANADTKSKPLARNLNL
ncbi:uncharacterized protein ACA1_258540 [Acanthamoeba castellanii str. Neff]|uniref:Uncharacterized protein n=1 Tax=Acanthamoeba castellanii (strain ATCC 30010 / Neff) TaxID=1257118 RepID=L8GF54_ACACF|nr:uncharacterized protein ACA1_258540 [Acanthamoeba castellanii str. Neff]ELR11592.1 hypothetical protein ACA1_258540 [Acanthamoeba castellanii str. Neff]